MTAHYSGCGNTFPRLLEERTAKCGVVYTLIETVSDYVLLANGLLAFRNEDYDRVKSFMNSLTSF